MKLTRFKLAFLSYALFDLLIGGHCGGLLPLEQLAAAQMTPAQGNITAASASCLSTNCVTLQLDGATGAASIQLIGTFTATVSFEVSNDNGTTWVAINGTPPNSTTAVTSATSTGLWQFNVAGFTNIRARGSAYTSGTAAVVINSARASAKSGGGAVFASGGTTVNVIPKSNGSSQLADSSLTDDTVKVTGTLPFRLPDGTSAAPSYSFTGSTGVGLAQSGGVLYNISSGGVNYNTSAGVTQYSYNMSTGFITRFANIATAGTGVSVIYGATSQKAETTSADANVLTYTPPAAVGTYKVSVNISVSSATSGVIAWTLSWTDSNGNAQSNIAMPLFQLGTAAPNTTFTTSAAGNYTGTSTIDVNNAAAAIVVKWVGGGTTAAKMSAIIERVQ